MELFTLRATKLHNFLNFSLRFTFIFQENIFVSPSKYHDVVTFKIAQTRNQSPCSLYYDFDGAHKGPVAKGPTAYIKTRKFA